MADCTFKVIDGKAVCETCPRVVLKWVGEAEDIVAPCRSPNAPPAKSRVRRKSVPQKSRRPRTDEEVKAVRATCKTCEHRTEGGGEYDAGLCKLKLGGCSSCKSIETFLAFQQSGAPCPDGRFEGTELVEVEKTAARES